MVLQLFGRLLAGSIGGLREGRRPSSEILRCGLRLDLGARFLPNLSIPQYGSRIEFVMMTSVSLGYFTSLSIQLRHGHFVSWHSLQAWALSEHACLHTCKQASRMMQMH